MASKYNPTPAFETARRNIDNLKNIPNPVANPGRSDMLLAYCLFKQTRDGDVTGSRPYLSIEGGMKYDAWAFVQGMARQEADARYVNCAEYILEGKELNDENKTLLDKIGELGKFW